MPAEGQGSSLRAVLKQAPGLPSPSREPAREDMMKCQISSIIVTPPKIIGRVFCQCRLMAPTGERATLMVVSSVQAPSAEAERYRIDAQARRNMSLGVGRQAAVETARRSFF